MARHGPGLPLPQGLRVVGGAKELTGWQVAAKKGHRQHVPLGTVQQVRSAVKCPSRAALKPGPLSLPPVVKPCPPPMFCCARWTVCRLLGSVAPPISCCGWCSRQCCSPMASGARRCTCCPWCLTSSQHCTQSSSCWWQTHPKARTFQKHTQLVPGSWTDCQQPRPQALTVLLLSLQCVHSTCWLMSTYKHIGWVAVSLCERDRGQLSHCRPHDCFTCLWPAVLQGCWTWAGATCCCHSCPRPCCRTHPLHRTGQQQRQQASWQGPGPSHK